MPRHSRGRLLPGGIKQHHDTVSCTLLLSKRLRPDRLPRRQVLSAILRIADHVPVWVLLLHSVVIADVVQRCRVPRGIRCAQRASRRGLLPSKQLQRHRVPCRLVLPRRLHRPCHLRGWVVLSPCSSSPDTVLAFVLLQPSQHVRAVGDSDTVSFSLHISHGFFFRIEHPRSPLEDSVWDSIALS